MISFMHDSKKVSYLKADTVYVKHKYSLLSILSVGYNETYWSI